MLSSDLSFPSSGPCGRAEALRDYAFDELQASERRAMEQHLVLCGDCALELDRLRLTAAALRTLPDREVPQRIAFVSDRVFQPSVLSRFWNSGARLGFASACVVALALIVSAWRVSVVYRPAEVRTLVRTESASPDQINAAVAQAVAQVRAEDARIIQAAIQTSEQKRDAEYRNEIVAMQESVDVLKKRLGVSYAMLASNDGAGAGQ
jgi:hypothetical protein